MTSSRGFILSLVYVLSMSVAYTIAGVIAGIFEQIYKLALQNPYVLVTFALVLWLCIFNVLDIMR